MTCAHIVVRRLSVSNAKPSDENFSLPDVVLAYEGSLIEQVLESEAGKLSRAAKRLGITRQRLTHILKTRHSNLWHKRTPPTPRRKSYTNAREPHRTGRLSLKQRARPVSILFVEDHPIVAEAVKDILEMKGWRVEVCGDGASGRSRIESNAHFDLLILDHELSDEVKGLQLVRLARSLAHRQHVPIIMLSASEVENEALNAGANAFLRKPHDIGNVTARVTRLLSANKNGEP